MLIFVLLTTMFTANDFTANDLKQACASNVLVEQAFCLGFLKGFNEGGGKRLNGCPSEAVTVEQERLVFLKYVDNHPEELHWSAGVILSVALSTAFPCRADKEERR